MAFVVRTIKKEQAEINFDKSARDIKQFILGMNPSPIAYTSLCGKKLKIYKATVADGDCAGKIGEAVKVDKELLIKTGDGLLNITELQEEGGKKMDAKSFLAGRKIKLGDVLGEKND